MQNSLLADCIVEPRELSLGSKHHDKRTYHVLNARPAPGKTRIPGYCIASVHVRLQKIVPTFCTKSFPAPPHALTPFTGQQKRRPGVSGPSAWATDPRGRALHGSGVVRAWQVLLPGP